jgi:hypothetical protein
MGENTEDYDITLLSAEEAMRQIVKGYVITPRLLKEGEPVAAELSDYLSDFKDVFSEREASILSEDMGVEYAIDLERGKQSRQSLGQEILRDVVSAECSINLTVFLRLPEPMLLAKSRL